MATQNLSNEHAARIEASAPGIAARVASAPATGKVQLEDFVFRTLDAWGASLEQIVPDVWNVQLPEGEGGLAARYLGRPTSEVLITFDLSRWDDGARLECLTLASPLTRRLMDYAEGRGGIATATLASRDTKARYCPYLLARLSARYRSDQVLEESGWLAINCATGSFARVHGSPFDRPDLVEGEPKGTRVASVCSEERALEAIVGSWQEEVHARAGALQAQAEQHYQTEAHQLCLVYDGQEQARRLAALAERYALSVDVGLEAILRLWRPLG